MDAIALQKIPTFGQDNFDNITDILANDGIILYPTDTIWGLGCDATNPVAVERIYNLKQSDRSNSFILLVDSIAMLKEYVSSVHPRLETLMIYHTATIWEMLS